MPIKSVLALLVCVPVFANCGGGNEPASPPPAGQESPAVQPQASTPPATPEPAKPAETPAAPQSAGTAAPATPEPAPPAKPAAAKPAAPEHPAFTRTDLQTGSGAVAKKGARLQVHYAGWLYDPTKPGMKGRMFDTSKDRGQPFDFVLGAGQVIPGWDQGFDGMKVGGRRRLIIPSDLAYGVEGAGNGIIPPNSTLLFEMELLDVQ